MCGIAAAFDVPKHHAQPYVRAMLERLLHRGFSHYEIRSWDFAALAANRLEIVDPDAGRQPIVNEDGTIAAVLNGEIYNHAALRAELSSRGHVFRSACDTECIVHAYEEWGTRLCDQFRGMYAFAVFDSATGDYFAARDPMGVKPLYWGRGSRGGVFFASEAKGLIGFVERADLLPPGHSVGRSGVVHQWAVPDDSAPLESFQDAVVALRDTLREAVAIRLPPALPFGVFLSGGLDSSLILALASETRPDVVAIIIGLPDSPETAPAVSLCDSIGVRYEVVELAFSELVEPYANVIRHLESFEPNLVRASLISYQLALRARRLGLRVMLAGEGADELFGGYDDFKRLPPASLASELQAFVADLHRTQLLRWDKMGMAHTVEVRTPYMDRHVVSLARDIPVDFKLRRQTSSRAVETKAVLREAAQGILPEAIRWRPKIPMDEGLLTGGRGAWNDLIASYVASQPKPHVDQGLLSAFCVTGDEEMLNLELLLRHLPPGFIAPSRIKVRNHNVS